MYLSHKIALRPNNKQQTYFKKAAGTARFAYNWALAEWKTQYEAPKVDPAAPKPHRYQINKKLNSIKHTKFPPPLPFR